jgi:hypothetical protein
MTRPFCLALPLALLLALPAAAQTGSTAPAAAPSLPASRPSQRTNEQRPAPKPQPHDLPYAEPFGPEARGFAQGAFAAATRVELLRSAALDPYGRTLGYLFVDGKNYSVLVVRARYSAETVSFYGDNGLPEPAAEVVAAARDAGPLPFEPPHVFRARMRDLSRWMKERGVEAEQ